MCVDRPDAPKESFFDPLTGVTALPSVSMFLANPFKPDLRVKREALSLQRSGYEVRIICWDRECRLPHEEIVDGVKVYRIRVRAPYGRFLPLVPGFLLFYINLLLKSMRIGVDAVHCHDMDTLVPGLLVSRLRRAILVYDMHESYPDFISTFAPRALVWFLRFVEPMLIRRADLVIATSGAIADIATRAGAAKVIVVMNCFDPLPAHLQGALEIRRSLARADELLVLYVGGLFAGRGLEEVVEAVSRLEGVKLFMGGYGPLEADLRSLVKRLGAEEKVIFGGEIDPEDVPKYDAAADALLALYKATDPNNVLTIPNKLFESIAAGKPIIVSNIGEKSRLVSTEGNGIVVDPCDIGAIAQAIRTLRSDRHVYEAMASSARRCQEKYSWSKMEAILRDAYAALLPPREVSPSASGKSPC